MFNEQRLNLPQLLEEVKTLKTGDYAEVGVYQGDTARFIAGSMAPGSRLWLFDSFAGHGEPSEFDKEDCHPKGRYADTSEAYIMRRMSTTAEVRIIKGWVPETLTVVKDIMFRFVRIDVDHYLPTRESLEFFMPRMMYGGIIEFDDWMIGDCPGATRAIQEVLGDDAGPYWRAV